MKVTTVYLGVNKIELFNSLLGKETVKVNGQEVSSKSPMAGTEHNFIITENDKVSNCKLVTGFGVSGVVFDLYRDNQPIIESPKVGLGRVMIFLLVIFIVGVVLGFFNVFG